MAREPAPCGPGGAGRARPKSETARSAAAIPPRNGRDTWRIPRRPGSRIPRRCAACSRSAVQRVILGNDLETPRLRGSEPGGRPLPAAPTWSRPAARGGGRRRGPTQRLSAPCADGRSSGGLRKPAALRPAPPRHPGPGGCSTRRAPATPAPRGAVRSGCGSWWPANRPWSGAQLHTRGSWGAGSASHGPLKKKVLGGPTPPRPRPHPEHLGRGRAEAEDAFFIAVHLAADLKASRVRAVVGAPGRRLRVLDPGSDRARGRRSPPRRAAADPGEPLRFLAPFPPLMSRHSWGAGRPRGRRAAREGGQGRGERGACQLSREGAKRTPGAPRARPGVTPRRCGLCGLQA